MNNCASWDQCDEMLEMHDPSALSTCSLIPTLSSIDISEKTILTCQSVRHFDSMAERAAYIATDALPEIVGKFSALAQLFSPRRDQKKFRFFHVLQFAGTRPLIRAAGGVAKFLIARNLAVHIDRKMWSVNDFYFGPS